MACELQMGLWFLFYFTTLSHFFINQISLLGLLKKLATIKAKGHLMFNFSRLLLLNAKVGYYCNIIAKVRCINALMDLLKV